MWAMSRSGYPRAYGEALNVQLVIQLHLIGLELQQLAPGFICWDPAP
jgi:hypothetical protein